jgi:hypothetical protein
MPFWIMKLIVRFRQEDKTGLRQEDEMRNETEQAEVAAPAPVEVEEAETGGNSRLMLVLLIHRPSVGPWLAGDIERLGISMGLTARVASVVGDVASD